jgi:hypothetical protein
MDKKQELHSLDAMYRTVSHRLTSELSKQMPDLVLIKDCRKQLLQLDKSIRTIQRLKEMGF